MPDAPVTPATSATPAATPEGTATPATPAAPAAPAAVEATPAVEFDGPYDEARAKSLIANLRKEAKEKADKLAAFEAAEKTRAEAEMTELQKAQKRAEDAEKLLNDAKAEKLRSDIAKEYGVPEVLLTAADEAGMKAQAEAVKPLIGGATPPAATPPGRPAPVATPGTGGAPVTPLDAAAMADRIRSL